MTKVGAVILNYNSYNLILDKEKLLNSYNCLNEIVIVDNCSSNDSFERLKRMENNKIKVVRTEKNGGYAYGNNYGLKLLEKNNDYAFIINPDVIIENKELEKIIMMMENNKEFAILGAIRTSKDNIYNQSQYWKIPTFWDEFFSYIYLTRKYLYHKETKYLQTQNKILKVGVVPGCLFLMNLKIGKEIDYFDENTFLYYEENILAKKINLLGFKCGICLNSKYIHNHDLSASKNNSNKKMKRYLYESKKYYFLNYLNLNPLERIILNILNYINRIERGIF